MSVKILLISLLILAAMAGNAQTIELANGKKIITTSVTALDNGDIEFFNTISGSKMRLPRKGYVSVFLPKPSEIAAADLVFRKKDYASAAKQYREAWMKYRFLGWNAYCLRMEAESLVKTGDPSGAASRLALLDKGKMPPDQNAADRGRAYLLAADLAAAKKDYIQAYAALDKVFRSPVNELAAEACMKKGDLLFQQKKFSDAALCFFQVVLLFPEAPERPEALFRTWEALTKLNDPRAAKFEYALRREFPNHELIRKLNQK